MDHDIVAMALDDLCDQSQKSCIVRIGQRVFRIGIPKNYSNDLRGSGCQTSGG